MLSLQQEYTKDQLSSFELMMTLLWHVYSFTPDEYYNIVEFTGTRRDVVVEDIQQQPNTNSMYFICFYLYSMVKVKMADLLIF